MRLKRLQRLEALRREPDSTFVNPEAEARSAFELIQANAVAVERRKAEWLEPHGPERQPTPALDAALRYLDGIAKRLTAPEDA